MASPPTPPNLGEEDFPSSFLLLSLLPFSFPSFLLPFLFPFFLSSFAFKAMSAAHHHHSGEDALQHYCNQVSLSSSLNPFCFYIHSSKLYICSCNLYRALVIDNHHSITPHHRGDLDHWGGGGGPCGPVT